VTRALAEPSARAASATDRNRSRHGQRSGIDHLIDKEEEMTGTLDWKWIGIGVVVMIVLNLIAGLILGMFLGSQLEGVTTPEQIQLSGGQIVFAAVLNFLAFAIGGFIVGLKSAGRTILEPGISAAVAVIIALLISGNFGFGNIIAGGIVPFIAGVLGGWLGERRQGSV
jgi:MFS family permease